ncbi:LuxR C-terminal-related transcriptional regulator [Leptospira sp. GIMC2001]|uniref:LuxR C-terminal-related transcriptional regulator n=1 Tax=Leptospira sp. GIMC2001 TaxID=1513297 RepID=UPI002349FC77|nr:response regulator transcription factor [Leptospira sp. GIMC2001]WCL50086.1 response regulator transcription factor [Leptospira sp. GIMC2001]
MDGFRFFQFLTVFESSSKKIPDVIVLDISLPGKSGLDLARELRIKIPNLKIILLSRHDQSEYIKEAKKIGVHAYVLKDEAGGDLLDAARSVLQGKYYLSPRLNSNKQEDFEGKYDTRPNDKDLLTKLTAREIQILKLIGEGQDNQKISDTLSIQPKTVKIHRQSIMDKLSIHKSTELVLFASKNLS